MKLEKVTAYTEIFPKGQKITAAFLKYDSEIGGAQIVPEMFEVKGRTITAAYISKDTKKEKSKRGKYVVLELSAEDENAATVGLRGEDRACRAYMKEVALHVRQKEDLYTADGCIPGSTAEIVSSEVINELADEFITGEFEGLEYNLYIPKGYEESVRYPLVLFIEDAWGCGKDVEIALAQGLGGVVWASPEEQAKHKCFVLAPQYPGARIVEDDFSATEELEITKRLLDHIIEQYSIDTKRVYTTGQSMGCMSSCELNIRYPDLFAASLLIAGPWNPETMVTLTQKNLWILVSAGDELASKYMNASVEGLEQAGADVARYYWDGKEDKEALNRKIEKAAAEGHRIKYTVFEKDSTVPEGDVKDIANNHRGTWILVYTLPAIRDWLFTNVKED